MERLGFCPKETAFKMANIVGSKDAQKNWIVELFYSLRATIHHERILKPAHLYLLKTTHTQLRAQGNELSTKT